MRASTQQVLRVCTRPRGTSLNPDQAFRLLTRAMYRPVKNRDGGPIAGVAFNGGGGSRQLGPDVNDPVSATRFRRFQPHHSSFTNTPINHNLPIPPTSQMFLVAELAPLQFPYSPPDSSASSPLTECQNSPQSESDDLCSACRGAGEFVCCEGCPRVFHLLCCDPPRLQVPEGSFYCYECTARLGLSEDVAAESYPSLGPLFKSLERTNQRAFALPSDVQNQFEDVSARGDGSYFEEMKKFPL
jgi:hypothetical protein